MTRIVPRVAATLLVWPLLAPTGCMKIGPDHVTPTAELDPAWTQTGREGITAEPAVTSEWWKVFGDPVLDGLVEEAVAQNLSLRTAGLRVVEAQARRGLAIGTLYPQVQQASAGYTAVSLSDNRVSEGGADANRNFENWALGFDASWELDLWGRFQRGIESADASLLASLADYDEVLVSLLAEVASTYVGIRTTQARLEVARENVAIQSRSVEITEVKQRQGLVTELDVAQARTLLGNTRAAIPVLEAELTQLENTLSILLGVPPQRMRDRLRDPADIPSVPAEVAIGLPAELLRQRPDVRAAERRVAAQSARIGIATADFYPRLALNGTIGVAASDFSKLWDGNAFEALGGPSFRWAILNYGRIQNNVRVQDAVYQQLVTQYEDTVLRAQREVEDAVAGLIGGRDQVGHLESSVTASERGVQLSSIQYREGFVDFTRVLNTQEALALQADRLMVSRGSVARSLIALYKALGGGWAVREGRPLLPEEVQAEMRERVRWGDLLTLEAQTEQIADAQADGESWWPLW